VGVARKEAVLLIATFRWSFHYLYAKKSKTPMTERISHIIKKPAIKVPVLFVAFAAFNVSKIAPKNKMHPSAILYPLKSFIGLFHCLNSLDQETLLALVLLGSPDIGI